MSETKTESLPIQQMTSPPGMTIGCYVTAKRLHANRILDLREAWPKIHFTAHWPIVRDLPREHNRPAREWIINNVDDIIRAATVVCFAEPEDVLCGSLFELGIAWAHGKQIWLVGDNPGYKEWKFAPRIKRAATIDQALSEIVGLIKYKE